MILPKREDRFFPEKEDLPLLELTAETGLWYRLPPAAFCDVDGKADKKRGRSPGQMHHCPRASTQA